MVRQCWDVQETFSRDAASLNNAIKAHCGVLSGFDQKIIAKAYFQWLGESTKFPAPAAISKICLEMKEKVQPSSRGPLPTPVFFQRVLDMATDEELEFNPSGSHRSPAALYATYGDRIIYTRMGREN